MTPPTIRVHVASADAPLRSKICGDLVRLGFATAGQSPDRVAALDAMSGLAPDVFIIDTGLPGIQDAIVTAQTIRTSGSTAIVFLDRDCDERFFDRVFAMGYSNFLPLTYDDRQLMIAVRASCACRINQKASGEAEYRQIEERLRETQLLARVGDWCVDRSTGTVYWSDVIYDIFGIEPGSQAFDRAAYLENLVHPEDRESVESAFDRSRSPGQTCSVCHRFLRPDGSIGWVQLESRLGNRHHDRPLLVRGTIQDITEIKRGEIALNELNSSLERRIGQRTAALMDSEARFRALFEQAAVGVSETETATGRPLRVNRKLAEITGYTIEELLSRPMVNLVHPDDISDEKEAMRRLRAGDVSEISREKRLLRKDGAIVWVSTTASRLWGPDENPGRHISVVMDITGRKGIEVAMRAISVDLVMMDGQEYLEAAARKLSDLLAVDFVSISRLERNQRSRLEAIVQMQDGATLSKDHFETIDVPGANAVDGETIVVPEGAALRFSNHRYMVDHRIEGYIGVPLVDSSGRTIGHLGIMSKRPLRSTGLLLTIVNMFGMALSAVLMRDRSRREYHDLFEFAPDGLVLCDMEGRIVLINQKAESIFGWTRAELKGQDFGMLVPSEAGYPNPKPNADLIQFSERRLMAVERSNVQARRKDGSAIPIEIDLAPVETDNGVMFAAAIRDVSQRKMLESQLAQSTKMEALGKLTGGMAHDFNNYLSVIIGNLDLLTQKDVTGPKTWKLIKAAMQAAQRSAELTESLLAFSRQQPLAPRVTDLNHRIEGIASLLQRTLGEDIEFAMRLSADLWPANIDAAQFDSCIVNLANNSRDAMRNGGTLLISTRNLRIDGTRVPIDPEIFAGDYAVIEISDSGSGMPPEIAARVFEPFFSTKGPGKGTGLGLSMVFGFVKQSGGYIKVFSEPEHGTTVRLYIPRSETQESVSASSPTSVHSDPCGAETILIVEDNENVRETATAQLSVLGYRVVQATDAETALTALESGEIDLLFTDVVMPGAMNGFALAQRAAAKRPELKILITSGFPGNAGPAMTAAEVPLLSKPYRLADLSRAVRAALDQPHVKS